MTHFSPAIPLLLLALTAPASGDREPIFRLDHPNRAPEFTDRPPRQGVEPVALGRRSTFPPLTRPASEQAPSSEPPPPAPEVANNANAQPSVAVLSPSPGEAIRANNGVVPLALALNPVLSTGEKLHLQLDGQTLMTTESPPTMLEGLTRGEHSLRIERLDREGRTLAEAQRTFYVLRTALGRAP